MARQKKTSCSHTNATHKPRVHTLVLRGYARLFLYSTMEIGCYAYGNVWYYD